MTADDLACLTDHELSDLIVAAAVEWKLRQRPGQTTTGRGRAAIAPDGASDRAPIDEPPSDDKAFVLHVKAKLQAGELILARDRRGVAAIAEQFTDWVRRQGLPTEGSASAWRDAATVARIGQATER